MLSSNCTTKSKCEANAKDPKSKRPTKRAKANRRKGSVCFWTYARHNSNSMLACTLSSQDCQNPQPSPSFACRESSMYGASCFPWHGDAACGSWKPQCTFKPEPLWTVRWSFERRQTAKRDSDQSQAKGPKDPKGQEDQRAKRAKGQVRPNESKRATHWSQGAATWLLFASSFGEKKSSRQTKQPGKDGNRARSAIWGQLFERAPASKWSSFQAIQSTMSFKLTLHAVCDLKDNESKCSNDP